MRKKKLKRQLEQKEAELAELHLMVQVMVTKLLSVAALADKNVTFPEQITDAIEPYMKMYGHDLRRSAIIDISQAETSNPSMLNIHFSHDRFHSPILGPNFLP
jgi:hypothetical protein